MMTPESVHALGTSSGVTDSGSIVSEWYRVAVNGLGSPARTPVSSCRTREVLPCSSSGARPTRHPVTTPSA